MRLAFSKVLATCLAVGFIGMVGGCGGGHTTSTGTHAVADKTVDIYSSLPMHGPTAETVPMLNGIKLALAQAGDRAGQFKVDYTPLDDSTPRAGGWDPDQTAANARRVAADPRAVYYVGDFDDGASEVSIPILNEAGMPQVSPSNTYVGLTTDDPGSAAGEPRKYYPTGTRTFLRIVPIDSVQAAADLLAMKEDGCTKVAVANDGEAYGTGLATMLELQKGFYGVDLISDTKTDPTARSYRTYAASLRRQGADCFEYAGVVSAGAVRITSDVHVALPLAKIFGPDQLCTREWTNSRDGGVSAVIAPLIECTRATQSTSAYPGGAAFLAAYKARYGVADRSPWAIFGYEAMKLGLNTIASLGPNGDSKSAVLNALFATNRRNSVLGTYGFNKNGDTTLKSYGLYKVGANGDPVFYKTLVATHVL
jgi:branched-chain amino acid transport system substrate-binding protein